MQVKESRCCLFMLGIYKTYMKTVFVERIVQTVLFKHNADLVNTPTYISFTYNTHKHMYVHTYTYIRTWVHVCTCFIHTHTHTHIYIYIYICKITTKSVHQNALHSFLTNFNFNGVRSFLHWERTNNISRYKITSVRICESKRDDWLCTANIHPRLIDKAEKAISLNIAAIYIFHAGSAFMFLRNFVKILRGNELLWISSCYDLLVNQIDTFVKKFPRKNYINGATVYFLCSNEHRKLTVCRAHRRGYTDEEPTKIRKSDKLIAKWIVMAIPWIFLYLKHKQIRI